MDDRTSLDAIIDRLEAGLPVTVYVLPPPPPEEYRRMPAHGASRYQNNGCRCDECRTNHAAHLRRWRHRNDPRYTSQSGSPI